MIGRMLSMMLNKYSSKKGYECIESMLQKHMISPEEACDLYEQFLNVTCPSKIFELWKKEYKELLLLEIGPHVIANANVYGCIYDEHNDLWKAPLLEQYDDSWKFEYFYGLVNVLCKMLDCAIEDKRQNDIPYIQKRLMTCIEKLEKSHKLKKADINYLKAKSEWVAPKDEQELRRHLISALGSNDVDVRNWAEHSLESWDNLYGWMYSKEGVKQKVLEQGEIQNSNNERGVSVLLNRYGMKKEDYKSRQFVYMVRDLHDVAGFYDKHDIRFIWTLKDYPFDIQFPNGHPQSNTLYIAHPAKDMYYIPCENSEKILFDEKIREFMSILTDLGATEISYRFIKGEEASLSLTKDWSAQAEVNVKVHEVSGDVNNSTAMNVTHSLKTGEWQTRKLNPTKMPFVAENRVWLHICPEWESFIHDRLSAGMLESTWRYTSSEVSELTNDRRDKINASYKNLITAIKGGGTSSIKKVFNASNEYEIEITAKFKPLEEFEDASSSKPTQVSIPRFTKEEETFRNEVLFCLEDDGALSDTDRKYLERKRVKLGVSEERANEIIEQCVPALTTEEQEYIETFKELVGEEEISARLRRMLDREAETLCITKERQEEIENSIKINR